MKNISGSSRIIHASAQKIYDALTSAEALETWQAPHEMTGKVHRFDLREGGGYMMSLYYPENEEKFSGKTNAKEDRFTVKFLQLISAKKIVQTVRFDTNDPEFEGEMKMEIILEPETKGTKVIFNYYDLPKGIAPEDNDEGTASSLAKLAAYVE